MKHLSSLLLAALAALVCPLHANPTFVVNAGAGADLVIFRDASSTFDSEAVPPSGAANIYAKLNGGAFLNTGNTNASLAYSFTVNDGDVLSLHRNSWAITAVSVYGFDLRSGDGATLLYNGAVSAGNVNTGGTSAPTLATGVPWEVTDPFDGSIWRLTFTAATADSADLVQGTAATPGAGDDRVDTITFTKVVPPDPQLQIATAVTKSNDGTPMVVSIPFSNLGATQNLVISSVTRGGPDADYFVVDSFTSPLAPGGAGEIKLTFTPATGGTYLADLTIASNDADSPSVVVTLTLNVLDPAASVTPAVIDYGTFASAPAAQEATIKITNQGATQDLTLDMEITGPGANAFAVGAYPASLAPAASANVVVIFKPGVLDGDLAATLRIYTNDPARPSINVPLSAVVKLADPAASLRSHFTFDDAANVGNDMGIFDNDGTVVGDAQRTTQARVGTGALLLDGNGDVVDVGNGDDYTTQLIANGEGFTVACWAAIPTDSANNRSRFFSAYMPGGWVTEGWGVGHISTSQLLATTYGKKDYTPSANLAPARGAWHHFAYVFRNAPLNRVDYYVDGTLAGTVTSTITGLNPATTIGFAIGALGLAGGEEQYFNGRIDDLRIYDRELVAANIADLFSSAPPLPAYETWAAANAGGGSPNQDFDQDGVANGIEYFMGETGSGFTASPAVVAGKITWPKGASYTGTYGPNHVVQTSPDLIAWTDVPLSGVSDGPSSVAYALVFAPEKPVWFVRLKVIP